MANTKSISSRAIRPYLYFMSALATRLLADAFGFPVDGDLELKIPILLEAYVYYCILYVSMILLLTWNKIPLSSARIIAMWIMLAYMYVHFLELLIPADGRVQHYAPIDNLWLNILTGFIATGDAGLWQIMRIFTGGLLLAAVLIYRRAPVVRALIGMLMLYLWGMLSSHAGEMIWLPQPYDQIPMDVLQNGIVSAVMVIWFTYVLLVIARVMSISTYSFRNSHPGSLIGFWVSVLLLIISPSLAPLSLPISPVEAYALLLSFLGLSISLKWLRFGIGIDAGYWIVFSALVFSLILLSIHIFGAITWFYLISAKLIYRTHDHPCSTRIV